MVQKIPCGPLREPVVVLVFGQGFVSGYLLRKTWSTEFFCCSAVDGLSGALATVITPAPLGSASVICSLSLGSTTHPAGTGSVKPRLDAVGPVSVIGDAIGLGEPAGVGPGTSELIPPVTGALRWGRDARRRRRRSGCHRRRAAGLAELVAVRVLGATPGARKCH